MKAALHYQRKYPASGNSCCYLRAGDVATLSAFPAHDLHLGADDAL